MKIIKEMSLEDFGAWSGGASTLATLKEYNLVAEAEGYINEVLGETMTATDLNDFLWFNHEDLFESIGLVEKEDINFLDEGTRIRETELGIEGVIIKVDEDDNDGLHYLVQWDNEEETVWTFLENVEGL